MIDAQKVDVAEKQRDAARAEARRHAVDYADALRQRAAAFEQVTVLHQQASVASAAHRREIDLARAETPQLCAEIEVLSKSNTDLHAQRRADLDEHARQIAALNAQPALLRAANTESDRLIEEMRAEQQLKAAAAPTPTSPDVLAKFAARLERAKATRVR